MGNHMNIINSHHKSHSKNSSITDKIRLLVIGYIRVYITPILSVPVLIETVCSKYYGSVLINCIFQCKIDRYGYLMNMDTANKYNEKQHRDELRNEGNKLIEWQQYLFSNSSSSEDIGWNKILNTAKLREMIENGVPEAFRGLLWRKIVDIETIRKIGIESYGKNTLYIDLINVHQSPFHEEIWKDINKTCINHTRFGLYNYSKEINNITTNNDELYEYIDGLNEALNEYNDDPIERRRKRRRGTNKRLSHSARCVIIPNNKLTVKQQYLRKRHSASVGNLRINHNNDYNHYRKYSVTYFKHKVIDVDSINRCGDHNVNISDLERNATKTQLQLYNVLKAFSLYRRNIGYTSNCGLCVIAALLLLYMNEESVFWFLNSLCHENDKYEMIGLWRPTMPDIKLRLFQFEQLIQRYLSKISNHFHSNRIVSASMFYAQNWFKTIFTQTKILLISHEILFRIFDCFFNDGFYILFKFALGILKYHESKLLKAKNCDDIIEILRDNTNHINCNQFIKISLSFKITPSILDKLRNEFYSN